jgi:hypothetical protein
VASPVTFMGPATVALPLTDSACATVTTSAARAMVVGSASSRRRRRPPVVCPVTTRMLAPVVNAPFAL